MSGPVHLDVHGTGVQVHIPGSRVRAAQQALELDMALAERTRAHLWLAIVGHRISPGLAARLATDPTCEDPQLDAESIRTVGIGCFRCERELTPALVRSPCPGEPQS